MNQTLTLRNEWDKTFPKSEKVNHSKVTFHNRYGITLAADVSERIGIIGNCCYFSRDTFENMINNSRNQ